MEESLREAVPRVLEAVANVAIGYGTTVFTQMLFFPLIASQATLGRNLQIRAIFTVVSLARSFGLCRMSEANRVQRGGR